MVFPGPVVRKLPKRRLTLSCSAIGIPPLNITIIRNSTTLVNATNTARIQVIEEGNFICRATSKYGTDEKEFVVTFTGENTKIILLLIISVDKERANYRW